MRLRWNCGCESETDPNGKNAKKVVWWVTCKGHASKQGTTTMLRYHPKEYGAREAFDKRPNRV